MNILSYRLEKSLNIKLAGSDAIRIWSHLSLVFLTLADDLTHRTILFDVAARRTIFTTKKNNLQV